MPSLSERADYMPASPIRKLVPYAEQARKKGVDVIHLNIGQPDIQTPAVALAAIRSFDEKVIEYSHSAGDFSYREKLTRYYKSVGVNITPEDIIVTTGGSEAILFAMMVCMNPGDEVLVPEPFYANYNGFAAEAGIVIKPVRSVIDNDFALPGMDYFEQCITEKTKAVFICNPNNPTGYLYSKEEMMQLRDIVKKHDLFLFCDEVYREFCYDDHEFFSCLSLTGVDEHVVLIDSVSKRYSMCGVRLGALISRNKRIIDAALKLGQARLCPPHLAQVAATAALDAPESYFEAVKNEYLLRRNYLVTALNEIPGVYCPMPKGAFYTIVQLPVDDADRFAQWLLEDFSFNNRTVMVAPASGFYATEGLGCNQIRVAYVIDIDDLKTAVACLRKALEVYNSSR